MKTRVIQTIVNLDEVKKALILARNKHKEVYFAISLCLLGLRLSNIVKLQWGNIDFPSLSISIVDKYNRKINIDLSQDLLGELINHSKGRIEDDQFIFRSKSGANIHVAQLNIWLKRFLVDNELTNFSFQNLYYISRRFASSQFVSKSTSRYIYIRSKEIKIIE